MDFSFIGLLTYFFGFLAICLFIILIKIISKRKKDKLLIIQDEYLKCDSCEFEKEINDEHIKPAVIHPDSPNIQLIELNKKKNDVYFHEINEIFGNKFLRFLKFFSKNIESIGGERRDLVNIIYLSESHELYFTTGFYDTQSQSVSFRAGIDVRLGLDSSIQQVVHTNNNPTNFFFFDYMHDSNIKLDRKKVKSIQIELELLKKKRQDLYVFTAMKKFRAMSTEHRNTMIIMCICSAAGGFGFYAIIDLLK